MAQPVKGLVLNLFAQVRETLSRATWALLNSDLELAQAVIDGDQDIDDLTSDLELLVWSQIDAEDLDAAGAAPAGRHPADSARSWSAAPIWPSTSPSGP